MKLLALIALIPLALGPIPEQERTLTIGLCLGGEITIPLSDDKKGAGRDCHLEGCHAGNCRSKTRRGGRAN